MPEAETIDIKVATVEADALREILQEYLSATEVYPKFNSAHEGYAVLLEEIDELLLEFPPTVANLLKRGFLFADIKRASDRLWDEVKKNPAKHPERDERMREEAIQVGAMALRFLVDITAQ